jgi:hypothetical protein
MLGCIVGRLGALVAWLTIRIMPMRNSPHPGEVLREWLTDTSRVASRIRKGYIV